MQEILYTLTYLICSFSKKKENVNFFLKILLLYVKEDRFLEEFRTVSNITHLSFVKQLQLKNWLNLIRSGINVYMKVFNYYFSMLPIIFLAI